MLAALLAAVIAQPLDAEFTATQHGVAVSVRHPASWQPQPFDAPHGVARIVSSDGKCEARIFLTDELATFAARGQDQAAASAEFDFVDGKLLEPFVRGHQVIQGGTTYLDGRPCRLLVLAAPNGARQFLAGMLAGRRGVILAVGATAPADLDANRSTLSAVAQSVRVRDDRRETSWTLPLLAVVGVVLVVVVHRFRVRLKPSPRRC